MIEKLPYWERLPYWLSRYVVALTDGLSGNVEDIGRLFDVTPERDGDIPFVSWEDAAEALRYRDGDPWCHDYIDAIFCYDPYISPNAKGVSNPMNRLAAVLCDDGNAFRVLYRCIHNLGGSK